MKAIATFQFDRFSEFLEEFPRILFVDGVFLREKFLFRGHGDSNYNLTSSFDRRFSALPPVKRVEQYGRFERLLNEEVGRIGRNDLDADTALGLAQHYGAPTRMLDWTSSPLIAAYFAFHSCLTAQKPARSISIWALSVKDAESWAHLGLKLTRLESKHNARAERQLGFATDLRTSHDSLENFVESLGLTQPVLWRFDILSEQARPAFAFLDACNTRASSLFGEIEGAARTAFERLVLES